MNPEQIIEVLEEFNRFASELFGLSFVQKLQGSGYTISAKKIGDPVTVETRFPDDESIKAFISDIRRFFQKGDDTLKIHKLIPIYQLALIEKSEKDVFNKAISIYEHFNKEKTLVNWEGETIEYEKIWEVFVYGRYSHRTKGTKEIHDIWEDNEPAYALLKNEFIHILHTYLVVINNIVYANRLVIRRLHE